MRSEGASRPRRCGGSVACASKFTERERERAMGHGEKEREREVKVAECECELVFARVRKDQRMGRCGVCPRP